MARIDMDLGGVKDPNELLEPGFYTLNVIESSLESNSKETGFVIKTTMEIVEGPHRGRRLWATFNYTNPSQRAQDIGRAEFKQLAIACGIPDNQKITDTAIIHDKPFKARVGVKPGEGQYRAQNIVTDYCAPAGYTASSATPNGAVSNGNGGTRAPAAGTATGPAAAPTARRDMPDTPPW